MESKQFEFKGKGVPHCGPWHRNESEEPIIDLNALGHPAQYIADDGLIAAVNTAILLNKPLLITGNPGTGKSELAERIAWELQLGPVLRFEAQSLSEAPDIFYRFDLVGRMAESRLQSDQLIRDRSLCLENQSIIPGSINNDRTHPIHFIELGPLGKAIMRAKPDIDSQDHPHYELYKALKSKVASSESAQQPQASVVLIDEIDKASRDFPNDLLNGIDRMEFRLRELDNLLIKLPDKTSACQPIVIITSNLERDLPAPFLRRCAFYHINDPDRQRMASIIRARVFPNRKDLHNQQLPNFYQELLDFFFEFREQYRGQLAYEPGTSELIEVSRALKLIRVSETASLKSSVSQVLKAISTIAKHREDLERLRHTLEVLEKA